MGTNSSFKAFPRSTLCVTFKVSGGPSPSPKERGLSDWPMAPPYPCVWMPRGKEVMSMPTNTLLTAGSKSKAYRQMMNVLVSALSWLKLGRPFTAFARCRIGNALSESQVESVSRLEHAASSRAGWKLLRVGTENVGRVHQKLLHLTNTARKLYERASALEDSLDQYSSSKSTPDNFIEPCFRPGRDRSEVIDFMPSETACESKPIEPSRLRFRQTPVFHPTPHLDRKSADADRDPSQLALPGDRCRSVPKVRVRASRKNSGSFTRKACFISCFCFGTYSACGCFCFGKR